MMQMYNTIQIYIMGQNGETIEKLLSPDLDPDIHRQKTPTDGSTVYFSANVIILCPGNQEDLNQIADGNSRREAVSGTFNPENKRTGPFLLIKPDPSFLFFFTKKLMIPNNLEIEEANIFSLKDENLGQALMERIKEIKQEQLSTFDYDSQSVINLPRSPG